MKAFLVAVLVLLTGLHTALLAARVPLHDIFDWWFWGSPPRPAGAAWLLVLLAAAPALLLWLVLRRPGTAPGARGDGWRLLVLVLLGYGLQQGLAWTEGQGLRGMRNHIVASGHAEFAVVATAQPSVWDTLRDYESLLQQGQLGRFARTKPPGTLALYMLSQRLSNAVLPQPDLRQQLIWFRTFAALLWPLLCYLVLLPLYQLVKALTGDREQALWTCALCLFVPSLTLIVLHTDQVFFPLLYLAPLALAASAVLRRSTGRAALAGALCYAAAFCSFPLGTAALLSAAVTVALWRRTAAGAPLAPLLRLWAAAAAGLLGTAVLARLALNYHLLERYQRAIAAHRAWKMWRGGLHDSVYYAFANAFEYAWFLGAPLAVLAALRVALAVRGLRRGPALEEAAGEAAGFDAVALALAAVGVLLGLFGSTRSEVARLWLFLVPLTCALAIDAVWRCFPAEGRWRRQRVAALVLVLQALSVYAVKRFMDPP